MPNDGGDANPDLAVARRRNRLLHTKGTKSPKAMFYLDVGRQKFMEFLLISGGRRHSIVNSLIGGGRKSFSLSPLALQLKVNCLITNIVCVLHVCKIS